MSDNYSIGALFGNIPAWARLKKWGAKALAVFTKTGALTVSTPMAEYHVTARTAVNTV
ncbi:hypothetical protein [Propionivibrio sp.]|uniref:hypothetical protein n=1 Tax=Propionivibrio sp. TaxID=2212460 RepID=UPI003BF40738